jgi:hypothetical protein
MDASVEDGYTLPMSLRINSAVRPEPVEGLTTSGVTELRKQTQWLLQPYPITVAGAVPDLLPSKR